MKNYLSQIDKKSERIKSLLLKDLVLKEDIDFNLDFIPPYSKAKNIADIKLIIIGQDPTVRRLESREQIKNTLNLDKKNSLKRYLNIVCDQLHVGIDKEVYATNLYKCFFNNPPADDETILTRQFKNWADLLRDELSVFNDAIIITLGQPIIRQLIHTSNRDVKYYWDYIGNTKSGGHFKFVESNANYLQRRFYPIAHQPTWSRNKFYNEYLSDYLEFIKKTQLL